jgi:hypothetical protein
MAVHRRAETCRCFFLLLTSLLPEPLVERQARPWITERLRERRYLPRPVSSPGS